MATRWGAARLHSLSEATEGVHAPSATVQRIAVLGMTPRAGTSTAARMLAHTFARHRRSRIVHSAPWSSTEDAQRYPEPTAEQRAALPAEATDGLRFWHGVWWADAGVNDRWFDVSVVDAGVAPEPPAVVATVAGASVVCLVSTPDRSTGDRALALAEALENHPGAPAARVIFTGSRRARSPWAALVCDRHPLAATVVPFDPALSRGDELGASESARVAYLTAASALMTAKAQVPA